MFIFWGENEYFCMAWIIYFCIDLGNNRCQDWESNRGQKAMAGMDKKS